MKSFGRAAIAIAALALAAALAYFYFGNKREKNEADEETVAGGSRVRQGTNGQSYLTLNLETRKLIGLRTTTLAAAAQAPALDAYGRVLDPAPLVAQLSDAASARAELEASGKEYARLQKLFQQGENASASKLEGAKAAMERNQIALQNARAQLAATWGEALANRPDLQDFVQSLISVKRVLARLDLPAGETPAQAPTGGWLRIPGRREPVAADYVGRAPRADPQAQGAGFFFTAPNRDGTLAPGLNVGGSLSMPGPPRRGVIVPEEAVVRSGEQAWVYARTGEANFARREIRLNDPVAGGWFVTNGLAPGDRLVTIGAQALLSEERKTQIKLPD